MLTPSAAGLARRDPQKAPQLLTRHAKKRLAEAWRAKLAQELGERMTDEAAGAEGV